MEFIIQKTSSTHAGFIQLVQALDAEIADRNKEDFDFYNQYNQLDNIEHVLMAFHGAAAVGCGAIKPYDQKSTEIKRMFVTPDCRGKGLATRILVGLEQWSIDLGYNACVLETGVEHTEAIQLYKKNGYRIIPNYGQYAGIEKSVCFFKSLQ